MSYRIPAQEPVSRLLRERWRAFHEALRYAQEVTEHVDERSLAEAELRHLGRISTPRERREAELHVQMSSAMARKQFLADMVPTGWVQEFLGVSRQAINQKLKGHKLLAVEENGRYHFPRWQFDADAPGKVLRGLQEVLPVLDATDYAKAKWFTRPQVSLQRRTPLEMLKEGKIRDVLIAARGVGAF